MNDNRKSILQQALESVSGACECGDITDRQFRDMLEEFKIKLDEIETKEAAKKQSH